MNDMSAQNGGEHRIDRQEVLESLSKKLVELRLPDAEYSLVSALEVIPRILKALDLSPKGIEINPVDGIARDKGASAVFKTNGLPRFRATFRVFLNTSLIFFSKTKTCK